MFSCSPNGDRDREVPLPAIVFLGSAFTCCRPTAIVGVFTPGDRGLVDTRAGAFNRKFTRRAGFIIGKFLGVLALSTESLLGAPALSSNILNANVTISREKEFSKTKGKLLVRAEYRLFLRNN